MGWLQEHGWEHLMLQATMEVNHRLETKVSAVASPDKIEEALAAIYGHEQGAAEDAAQSERIFRENVAREILNGVHVNGNGAKAHDDSKVI
jgi:hypothetical protein